MTVTIQTSTVLAKYTDAHVTVSLAEQHIPYPGRMTRDFIVRVYRKTERRWEVTECFTAYQPAARCFSDYITRCLTIAAR